MENDIGDEGGRGWSRMTQVLLQSMEMTLAELGMGGRAVSLLSDLMVFKCPH